MRRNYCTAVGKEHFDSLTEDYKEDGWTLIFDSEYIREFIKDDALLIIELV